MKLKGKSSFAPQADGGGDSDTDADTNTDTDADDLANRLVKKGGSAIR
jgi:hypothetical protein